MAALRYLSETNKRMTTRDDTRIFEKFSQYIALVGRGQKSGKTMNQAQAQDAMARILNNEALPEQVGALLMLLRMREETTEELSGLLLACRQTLPQSISTLGSIDLDLGCYAGKRRHLPWLLLSVILLAQQGYKVFMHGLEESDSNRLYLDTVFKSLNIPIAKSVEEAKLHLAQRNFCYMSIKDLHPQMASLLGMRHTLGLRSCMHTLAKMLNPANAKASVHGVFHRELDNHHIEVAKILGESKVACIRGDSGEVEATPEKAFSMQYLQSKNALTREFPVLLSQWSHQTRQLQVHALPQVWCGELDSLYGQAASIGTAAVALSCMENLSTEDALSKAQKMWDERNKVWPIV
jgi:anthranilate phosphoribosyltransferase